MSHYSIKDFDFALPEALIAQQPLEQRSASRLMQLAVSSQQIRHGQFTDISQLVTAKDLLVFNDTKVIPARLYGCKSTGGKIECLIERILPEQQVLAHIKASQTPKKGNVLYFAEGQLQAEVIDRLADLFCLRFLTDQSILEWLAKYGHIPLPPYINRPADQQDQSRYQTVYAQRPGAIAAPTAGLHFDQALLKQLKAQGTAMTYVTLHVGAGTFQPVRVEDITQHQMHSEVMQLSDEVCQQVQACRERGGRVIAVGTTAVRCLETAAKSGEMKAYEGETNLFIYPGYQFQAVDALITNFHLPKSSLLMLVSALAGCDLIKQAYRQAVEQQYRFFSYGDAMFIDR